MRVLAGQGKKLSIAFLVVVLGSGLLAAGSASADEFELSIELGEDVDESEFMAGFQLAVDESPDVSHPAGREGGDHLGAIDVAFTVAVRGFDDGALGAVTDAGFPITVVDISSEKFDGAEQVSAPDGMFIIFVDGVPPELPQSAGLFAVSREMAAATAASLSASFEADFAAAYGRPPSADAARGYAAAKLIDIAVGSTDRDPTDVATLRSTLDSAIGAESTGTTTATPAPASAPATAAAQEPEASATVPGSESPATVQESESPAAQDSESSATVSDSESSDNGSAMSWPAVLGAVALAGVLIGVFVLLRRRNATPSNE